MVWRESTIVCPRKEIGMLNPKGTLVNTLDWHALQVHAHHNFRCGDIFPACTGFKMAPTTTILMATGKVGRSTIEELTTKHKGKVDIRGASRNPEKVDEALTNLDGVKFVRAHVGGNIEDMKVGVQNSDHLVPFHCDAIILRKLFGLNSTQAQLSNFSLEMLTVEKWPWGHTPLLPSADPRPDPPV